MKYDKIAEILKLALVIILLFFIVLLLWRVVYWPQTGAGDYIGATLV